MSTKRIERYWKSQLDDELMTWYARVMPNLGLCNRCFISQRPIFTRWPMPAYFQVRLQHATIILALFQKRVYMRAASGQADSLEVCLEGWSGTAQR